MKHAIALAVSAGLAAAAVLTYGLVIGDAASAAAQQTLIALGDTATMRALLEGGEPADHLDAVVSEAATRSGDPVTGVSVDGATLRTSNDDGCWELTVAGPFDPRPVTECKEEAS